MLTGKELGAAIGEAIRRKIDSGKAPSKAAIARHFGVQPPSLADWVKKGTVSKDRLIEMWKYFSDVVGPDHWGIAGTPSWNFFRYDNATESYIAKILLNDGWAIDRIKSSKELPDEFKEDEQAYIPDFVVSKGDTVFYVEVKNPQLTISPDSPWLNLARTGKLALITADEPSAIRDQLQSFLRGKGIDLTVLDDHEPSADEKEVPSARYEAIDASSSGLILQGGGSRGRAMEFAAIGTRRIPLISSVQAGHMTAIVDPYSVGGGSEYLLTDLELSPNAFALEIKGESMLPEFRPGDRVIIDPNIQPLPGDFVVAKNGNEEATFKKYRPRGLNEHGDEVFELIPLNEDYPSMRSDQKPIRIIGTMVEHRKYRKR